MAQDEPSRIERIKLHFKEHRKEYLIGAGCFAAGVVSVVLLRRSEVVTKNISLLSYKPVQVNEVTTILARRGHPGFIIKCVETGEVFASQARAAAAVGASAGRMSSHLNGHLANVGGKTFERIGEAI